MNLFAIVLMYSNCALRSGCCFPSRDFLFACNVYPSLLMIRPMVSDDISLHVFAMALVDLQDHLSRLMGSPAVVSSRIFLIFVMISGRFSMIFLRPPPSFSESCRGFSFFILHFTNTFEHRVMRHACERADARCSTAANLEGLDACKSSSLNFVALRKRCEPHPIKSRIHHNITKSINYIKDGILFCGNP